MRKWKKTVKISDLLGPDDEPLSTLGLKVVERLGPHPEFHPVLEELTNAAHYAKRDGGNWFNTLLDEIYDIADKERIWLGI